MSSDNSYTKQTRFKCAAIVSLTLIFLTLGMFVWESVNLNSETAIDEDEKIHKLLLLQLELHGQPVNSFLDHIRSINLSDHKTDIKNTKNTKNTDTDTHLQHTPLEHSHYNSDPIYDNPLEHPQCQNALINKENIDKSELFQLHKNKIKCGPLRGNRIDRNTDNKWQPFIWSREFISALKSDACFDPKTPVRTTKDFFREKHFENSDNPIPVFYHIPKCGSSSTAAMTSELFNFSIHWKPGPETMHEQIRSKCGFAFIRDPMRRFISAYYTINKKIYREMKHEFFSGKERIPLRFKDRLTFVTVMGEPQRFEAFMTDLFREPYWWGVEDPLKHIASQTYFLSNWYGSDIGFFGRVEHFGSHWKLLMNHNGCEWFHDLYANNDETDLENYEVSHALFHYGTMGISLYRSRNEKQREYINALGMRDMLERMYGRDRMRHNISENEVLPPAYYFMTEDMYDRIVDFYHQDYVCFGYKPDYNEFKAYVDTHKNPFL